MNTPFALELSRQMRLKKRQLIKDDITGISVVNFMQMVRSPSPSLEGAPKSAEEYKGLFRSLCDNKDFLTFA